MRRFTSFPCAFRSLPLFSAAIQNSWQQQQQLDTVPYLHLELRRVFSASKPLFSRKAPAKAAAIRRGSQRPKVSSRSFESLSAALAARLDVKLNEVENEKFHAAWKKVAKNVSSAQVVDCFLKRPTPGQRETLEQEKFESAWLQLATFLRCSLPAKRASLSQKMIRLAAKCCDEMWHNMDLYQIAALRERKLFGTFTVLTNSDLAGATNFRHTTNSSLGIASRGDEVVPLIADTWKNNPGRVVLLCGSSGSGKTVLALDVAKHGFPGPNSSSIVFYLEAKSLALNVADDDVDRDAKIRENLSHQCHLVMNDKSPHPELNNYTRQARVEYSFDNLVKLDSETTHVVFVIDECGAEPEVLRGVISVVPSLSVELHNQIFHDEAICPNEKAQTESNSRVHFIAAGTGATYATEGAGSKADHFTTFYLDSSSWASNTGSQAVQARIYDLLLENSGETTFRRKYETDPFLRRLQTTLPSAGNERDDGINEHPLSIEEEQMAKIVTNARAAAAFLDDAKKSPTYGPLKMWAASLPAFRQFVSSSIPTITQSYFRSCGLWKTENPVETLSYAAAFALHRFPFAPVSLKPSEVMREARKSEKISKADLDDITAVIGQRKFRKVGSTRDIYHYLCTSGGVLVDFCEKSPEKTPPGYLDITPFVPKQVPFAKPVSNSSKRFLADLNNQKYCLDPRKTSARFQLPAAQTAMWLSSVGVPGHRTSSHWSGTEHLAADLCTVLAGSSRAIHNLYDAVNAEMKHFCGKTMEDYHAAVQKNERFADPLFALKKLLLFDRNIHGADYYRLHSSSLRDLNMFSSNYGKETTDDELFEKFKSTYFDAETSAKEINETLRNALSNNKAVVLQSPDMEQFADLIVVGPGRVILMPCKANVKEEGGVSTLKYFDELDKMHLLVHHESGLYPQKNNVRVCGMFREMWLAAVLHAAGRSPATGDGSFEEWLEKPRAWKNCRCEFEKGLISSARLAGTCPISSKVDLHVCFFIETKKDTLADVNVLFNLTLQRSASLNSNPKSNDNTNSALCNGACRVTPNAKHDASKPEDEKNWKWYSLEPLAFRGDLGLKSVELVAFARDAAFSQHALSPFTTSSVLKPKAKKDFEASSTFSIDFDLGAPRTTINFPKKCRFL